MIERQRRPEDVAFRRITEPLTAAAVLSGLAEVCEVPVEEFGRRRRDSVLRGVAGRMLVRYAGLTQREAAAKMDGASGDALSRQMRKVRELLETDPRVRRLLERVEERVDKLRQTKIKSTEEVVGSK